MLKEFIYAVVIIILVIFSLLFLDRRNKVLPSWAFELLFGILCVCIFIGGGFILLHLLTKLFA